MNTEPIDHATEARRLAGATSTRDWNNPSPYVDRRLAAAQVHATLALVEEQRTANLIALAAQVDDDRSERDLAERVIVRLGLREVPS